VRDFDTALLDRTLNAREQQRLAQLLRKLLVSLEPARSAVARVRFSRDELMALEV
jgi:hypothetical protein